MSEAIKNMQSSSVEMEFANRAKQVLSTEPILSARDVEVEFTLRGQKLKAIRRCSLDLYDGETLLSEDVRTTEIADNGQDHFYTMTAPAEVKKPRVLITFGNEENNRNTRGQFNITKD